MSKTEKHEAGVVASTEAPVTADVLTGGLEAIGVRPGMVLMMHSSLSALGWLPGGVQLLLETLISYLGPEGTLVVPTQSGQLTDPATWQAPPVPEAWHETIRKGFPAFDPLTTPTRSMGVVPETLRRWPGAVRSSHPHTSFAAIGKDADTLMADHELTSPLGPGSPLQKLVEAGAHTLLLGTLFSENTCFHLAEHALENPPHRIDGAPMVIDGRKEWVTFEALDYEDGDFADCGADFVASGAVTEGKIGNATSYFFRTQSAVEFAVTWLRQHR